MLTVPAPAGYREAAAHWIAIGAATCGFLFGYDIAVMSGALPSLRIDFALSPASQNLIASVPLACAIPGAAVGGLFTDRFGRRHSGMAASLLFALASLMSALAPTTAWLFTGRMLAGVAIGACCFLGPLYISEIASAETRGSLVSVNQLLIPMGALVGCSLNLLLANGEHWRWMFAAELFPAAAMGVAMFRLPESPRWLVLRRRFDQARQVLWAVRPTEEEVEDEMIVVESAAWETADERSADSNAVPTFLHRPAVMIAIALAILQQITGVNAILYYAPAIFQLTGVALARGSMTSVFAIGGVSIVSMALAVRLLDRAGRRPLLLAGLAGMTFSLCLLGAIFRAGNTTPALAWLAAAIILLYSGSFVVSFGSMFWLLLAEIFPLPIRGLAMGLATAATFAVYVASAASTQTLVEHLGLNALLWLYAAICAAALVFSYFGIPETRGWMLEDISARLNRSRSQPAAGQRR